MSDLQEVTFSDLLQRPNETVEKLKSSRSRALRVRRRGSEDDLVLTTVAREAEDSEVVGLAVRVLRVVMSDPVLRSHSLLDVLPQIFPWIRFASGRSERVRPGARRHHGSQRRSRRLGAVLTLIAQWRNTAHVYADPELLAIVSAPRGGDFGPVPKPTVE